MRPIKEKPALPAPIVHHDRKTTRGRNYKLLQFFVGMPSPGGACGHVIEVIHSPHIERNVPVPFNERQISPLVHDFGEIQNAAGPVFGCGNLLSAREMRHIRRHRNILPQATRRNVRGFVSSGSPS